MSDDKDWTGLHWWYGLDHEPISVEEAGRLLGDRVNRNVGFEQWEDGWLVSTVFLVLDHGWVPDADPILYETMVFMPDGEPVLQVRYATRADAEAGHAEAADAVAFTHDGQRGDTTLREGGS